MRAVDSDEPRGLGRTGHELEYDIPAFFFPKKKKAEDAA